MARAIPVKFDACLELTPLQQHLVYLSECCSKGAISETVTTNAWFALVAIKKACGGYLVIPSACTGPDKQMHYSWDAGEHHLELDIPAVGPSEWFYKNRTTGKIWSQDWNIGEKLNRAAIQRIKLLNF